MSNPSTTSNGDEQGSSSQAKIDANPRNALQSHGPTTERGKAAIGGNALKYGLTSSQVVIERIDGEGARQRFAALHSSLLDQFKPEDLIAEFRVQRVAENMWRLARHDRAEAAMLEKAHLHAVEDDLLRRSQLPALAEEGSAHEKAASIRSLIDRLHQLEEEIRRDGSVSGESLTDVLNRFGTTDPFAVELSVLFVTVDSEDPGPNARSVASSSMVVADLIDQAKELIAAKRQQLRNLAQEVECGEQLQRTAHLATLHVPSAVDFEKLWRSRGAVNKELEQDLAWLNKNTRQAKNTGLE